MASTYLTRTPSGAGTSNKIFTLSVWVKRSNTGHHAITGSGDSSGYNNLFLEFNNNHALRFAQLDSSSFPFEYITNRLFRDCNAWYHIVCTVDSTNSTEADRVKIYVNGVRETSFSTTNHPPLNQVFKWNDARVHSIGREGAWDARYFDGSMSHFHNIDGTAYEASTFGSTDATTGEWKINTSPSVTYGTNGFFILKDGNSVTDQSPNTNNFTVGGGTLTKTEDNPSNVFATWNPLDNYYSGFSILNGNLEVNTPSTTDTSAPIKSTIGVNSGKYYWEVKCVSVNTGTWTYGTIGITSRDIKTNAQGNHLGSYTEDYAYYSYNGHILNADGGNTGDTYGNSYTAGDIIGVALDLDNNKLYFSKNGTWQNSGVPTSGSTGTGAVSINAPTVGTNATGNYFPSVGDYHYAPRYRFAANFGNGTFQTTAVASAGTNASGNGIFEYDVPTGYTALSTKGLNL